MQILTEKIFAWSLDMGFLKATFATFLLLPHAFFFFLLLPQNTTRMYSPLFYICMQPLQVNYNEKLYMGNINEVSYS